LQAESAMKDMTTNLIAGLRTQNVRLAAAIRTIGWLQRVAPELEIPRRDSGAASNEGAFGGLFLVCRLANLVSMLGALDPLRELADQETQRRNQNTDKERRSSASAINAIKWSEGHQSERFLKRFIEIYREQSFAIVSLYKNIFASEPSDSTTSMQSLDLRQMGLRTKMPQASRHDPLRVLPPAMATFPMHLVQLLTDTLRTYLPNVQDRSSRESLLTQVLYCAASLGRLGGDFGMILTQFGESSDDEDNEGESPYEWEVVMKNHRDLAGRLEQLTSGTAAPGSDGASRAAPPFWG
jgi:conserved oligomeric Golgi complex subunit 8